MIYGTALDTVYDTIDFEDVTAHRITVTDSLATTDEDSKELYKIIFSMSDIQAVLPKPLEELMRENEAKENYK